jgi:hypothetical protein
MDDLLKVPKNVGTANGRVMGFYETRAYFEVFERAP